MAVFKELEEQKKHLEGVKISKTALIQKEIVSAIQKPDCCNFKNSFGSESKIDLSQISTPHETLFFGIKYATKNLIL